MPTGLATKGYRHDAEEGRREGLWDWEVRKEKRKATMKMIIRHRTSPNIQNSNILPDPNCHSVTAHFDI